MRQIHLGQMARIATLCAAPLLLSSCLLFFRGPKLPKERYNINEDSTFFSKMPPYSEEGKNIVAFEIDGKPYVYPKAGAKRDIFKPKHLPEWMCGIEMNDTTDSVTFYLFVERWGKKYNSTGFGLSLQLHKRKFEALFSQDYYHPQLSFHPDILGRYFYSLKDGSETKIQIGRLDREKRILSATFSGIVRDDKDHSRAIKIENGFFDVTYDLK